jgi:hypothetical protein
VVKGGNGLRDPTRAPYSRLRPVTMARFRGVDKGGGGRGAGGGLAGMTR